MLARNSDVDAEDAPHLEVPRVALRQYRSRGKQQAASLDQIGGEHYAAIEVFEVLMHALSG